VVEVKQNDQYCIAYYVAGIVLFRCKSMRLKKKNQDIFKK